MPWASSGRGVSSAAGQRVIEVVVVGEGQTEETFVRDVLGPACAISNILLDPRLIRTSPTGRGGALSYERVLRYLRNTLRQRADTYVTTFFDLYVIRSDFPGYEEAQGQVDPLARAEAIEGRMHESVVREVACRGDRFFAHIQPYEFEALLFSDVSRLVEIEPDWDGLETQLSAVRTAALSPEHINDGVETHPAGRLMRILRRPRYRKVLHGSRGALRIGLPRIHEECRHFAAWLAKLRGLRPLA